MLNHDKIIFLWGWSTAWRYAKKFLLKDLAYRVVDGIFIDVINFSQCPQMVNQVNIQNTNFIFCRFGITSLILAMNSYWTTHILRHSYNIHEKILRHSITVSNIIYDITIFSYIHLRCTKNLWWICTCIPVTTRKPTTLIYYTSITNTNGPKGGC